MATTKHRRHGMNRTPTHETWKAMIKRCTYPLAKDWKNYGGRGIKVCARWLEFSGFFKDMGVRPEGMELDRIDTNGDYEPSNCRWVTHAENSANRRLRLFEWNGESLPLKEWARRFGIPHRVLAMRILRRWPIHQAFTEPVGPARQGRKRASLEAVQHGFDRHERGVMA